MAGQLLMSKVVTSGDIWFASIQNVLGILNYQPLLFDILTRRSFDMMII